MSDPAQSSRLAAGGKPPRPKRKHRVRRAFLLGLLLVPGLIMCIQQAVFQAHSAEVTATIIGYEPRHVTGRGSCAGGVAYDPKGRFTTTDGHQVTAVIENSHYCAPPANGATLQIRYDTNDPSAARDADAGDNWGIPVLFVVMGALVAGSIWASARSRAVRRG